MGAAARKGVVMITTILIFIAIVLFLGIVEDKEKFNKKIYCCGFVTCVIAVVILEVVKMVI